jgi:hypothetical protein
MKPFDKSNLIIWGFLLGIFVAFSIETGLYEVWQPIGKPPEEITKIVGANSQTVYVQTSSGNSYRYNFFSSTDESVPSFWEIETGNDYFLYPQNTDSGYFITLPPLFRVNQSLSIHDYLAIENGGIRRFVIDPNGSMWMWRHFSTGMGIVFLPIFPLAGIILGTFAALVWHVIQLIVGRDKRIKP